MAVNIEIVRQLVDCIPQAVPYEVPDEDILSLSDLPMDWRIEFEERAAILEFDGGLTRQDADKQALREIWARIQRIDQ